jgi:hypothetical protein
VSIHKIQDGEFKVRWREGARNRSVIVHGSYKLAKKILHKKLAIRAENRHLDVTREINCRMSALIDRYWERYPTPGQAASQAVGQELIQTGAQITRRNLNLQPTIKVPVGYKFTVRVNRDILFEAPFEPMPAETPEAQRAQSK